MRCVDCIFVLLDLVIKPQSSSSPWNNAQQAAASSSIMHTSHIYLPVMACCEAAGPYRSRSRLRLSLR